MGKKKRNLPTKSNKGYQARHKYLEALSVEKVQVDSLEDPYTPEELCLLWEEGHVTGNHELLLFQALLSSGWITLPYFDTEEWQSRLKELIEEGKIKEPIL